MSSRILIENCNFAAGNFLLNIKIIFATQYIRVSYLRQHSSASCSSREVGDVKEPPWSNLSEGGREMWAELLLVQNRRRHAWSRCKERAINNNLQTAKRGVNRNESNVRRIFYSFEKPCANRTAGLFSLE